MNRNDFASGKKEEDKTEPKVSEKVIGNDVANDPVGFKGQMAVVSKSLIPDAFIEKMNAYIPKKEPK